MAEVLPAPKPVLEVVQQGYALPLLHLPGPWDSPNHASALCNVGFVNEALADLLCNGYAKWVMDKPHISSPLLVVENSSSKKRLVINLKYLDLYLWKEKFK